MGGRLVATNVSSAKKILACLRLVEAGLKMLQKLRDERHIEVVKRSVSALCVRACLAIREQGQGAEASASGEGRARLVEAGLPQALSAVLSLQQGLSR